MKINDSQAQDLLALARQDQKLAQGRNQLQQLVSGESLSQLRTESSSASAELLLVQNQFEAVAIELKKTETDLDTVVQRIDRDRDRLNQSSSTKDIAGIEAELATLAKRRSDLEDVELAQLEAQEDIDRQLQSATGAATAASAALAEATSKLESEIAAARAELDSLALERGQLHARLGAELAELYERKAVRGVPAGRLSGGECGACRMQVGAVELDHLLKAPVDEVVFCPECQAILVRN